MCSIHDVVVVVVVVVVVFLKKQHAIVSVPSRHPTCLPPFGFLLLLLLLLPVIAAVLFSLALLGLARIVSLAGLVRRCFATRERFRRGTGGGGAFSILATLVQNTHVLGIARIDESSCRGTKGEPGPSAHSVAEEERRKRKTGRDRLDSKPRIASDRLTCPHRISAGADDDDGCHSERRDAGSSLQIGDYRSIWEKTSFCCFRGGRVSAAPKKKNTSKERNTDHHHRPRVFVDPV